MVMIGLLCTWECAACGSVMRTQEAFYDKRMRKTFRDPAECRACQDKRLTLTAVEQCEFMIKPPTEKQTTITETVKSDAIPLNRGEDDA